MNETFVEISSVVVDMSTKCIAYMVGDYFGGGRVKKLFIGNLDDFICIKMSIETESGERIFAKLIKPEPIDSIEVLYV